jgi:hypothetical protein
MREFKAWGVPLWARWLLTGVFSLTPINGLMSITLWKDIPYTVAMLGMFVILLRLVRTSGDWLKSWPGFSLTAVTLFAISIYRHNGFVVAVLLTAVLAWWLRRRRYRQRITWLGLGWLIAWAIVTGPIYKMIGVTPMDADIASQNLVHQVGAIIKSGAMLAESDNMFLGSIQPIESWRDKYNCYSLNPLAYNNQVDVSFFDSHAEQFSSTWFHLVLEHPEVIIQHPICVTSMV